MNEPFFQAFLWTITVLSLLGTVLNVRKKVSCFYLWMLVNIAWIGVDVCQGLWARFVLDSTHLVFAIWGIVSWRDPPRSNGREVQIS